VIDFRVVSLRTPDLLVSFCFVCFFGSPVL